LVSCLGVEGCCLGPGLGLMPTVSVSCLGVEGCCLGLGLGLMPTVSVSSFKTASAFHSQLSETAHIYDRTDKI